MTTDNAADNAVDQQPTRRRRAPSRRAASSEQPVEEPTGIAQPAEETAATPAAEPPRAIFSSPALNAVPEQRAPDVADSAATRAETDEDAKPARRRAPRRAASTPTSAATAPTTDDEATATSAEQPSARRTRSRRRPQNDVAPMAEPSPVLEEPAEAISAEPALATIADAWEGVEAAPASPDDLLEIQRALATPAPVESVAPWELDDDQAIAFDPTGAETDIDEEAEEIADEADETEAGEGEPARRRRRRRGRRGRGRGATGEDGTADAIAPEAPPPAPSAVAPADGWSPRLPSYPVAFEPTPPPTKRRPARRPGSTASPRFSPEEQREIDAFVTNGGAGSRTPAAEPLDAAPLTPEEQQALEAAAARPRRRRGGARRSATPAESAALQLTPEFEPLPAAPVVAAGGATLEALLARQNVLLNTMMERQIALLRNIERALVQLDRRMSGAGGAAASTPRVGIFVDVPNVMYAAERLGWNIDFGKLLVMLTRGRELVRASAYAPVSDDPQVRLETQRFTQPFIGRGYRIVTKPLKRFADGTMKGNFDVEMAMDMLTMADRLDIVCLISGDGDFAHLVEIVESRGVRVEVAAFSASTSGDLRAVCDDYIDLTHRQRDIAQ